LVWLHGVSVGESLSLLPLIAAIRTRRPDLTILVTSGTVTSAGLLARRLPPGVIHQFAPVDTPGAAKRFLDHWRPGAALFVESELWPNLIAAAARRGARLALISARMTQESAQGWRRAPQTARALLGAFDLVLAQDEATAGRLADLGGRDDGRLNLKLLGEAPPVDPDLEAALRKGAGKRRLVLAASTHPGEEALIAKAFQAATAAIPAVLAVAPRHPDRGPQVAAELEALGLRTALRSTGAALTAKTDAYVADTLGELGAFYAAADAVVMGGGFAPGVGGHNPLEAARLACPLVTGPHVPNARSLYDGLKADTAVIEAADGAALARHLRGLLENPEIARRIGLAAQDFAARQADALGAAMARIEPLLPA
jgi:3-deoxy-D-manno-octulosonic-acid transferase